VGGSSKKIAAVSGHKKLAMVERYTEDADKKRLASEAMRDVHERFEEPIGTSTSHTPEPRSHTAPGAVGNKGK
jgi:hypothetical protein